VSGIFHVRTSGGVNSSVIAVVSRPDRHLGPKELPGRCCAWSGNGWAKARKDGPLEFQGQFPGKPCARPEIGRPQEKFSDEVQGGPRPGSRAANVMTSLQKRCQRPAAQYRGRRQTASQPRDIDLTRTSIETSAPNVGTFGDPRPRGSSHSPKPGSMRQRPAAEVETFPAGRPKRHERRGYRSQQSAADWII